MKPLPTGEINPQSGWQACQPRPHRFLHKPNCADTFFSSSPLHLFPSFPFLLVSTREGSALTVCKAIWAAPRGFEQTRSCSHFWSPHSSLTFNYKQILLKRSVTNILCKKVPLERMLVSSSPQSLSALKHHHYMSFSAQLPLNTKRGIVQSNPVVNTKWSHFIATALLLFSPLRFWKSFKWGREPVSLVIALLRSFKIYQVTSLWVQSAPPRATHPEHCTALSCQTAHFATYFTANNCTVHCTLCMSVYFSANRIVALHIVQCALCFVLCVLFIVHCALCIIQCTMYIAVQIGACW